MIAAKGIDVPGARRADMPGLASTCAVHLIDRRTGSSHRVNGKPLVIFTRRPDEAAAELLSGRDASVWEARIEILGPQGA